MAEPAALEPDEQLLARAELALTQLNSAHGLSAQQSATLAAIRLRLEGKERATLEDLLSVGMDLGDADELGRALRPKPKQPGLDEMAADVARRPKKSLDDLL